jgi:hypothetical protein
MQVLQKFILRFMPGPAHGIQGDAQGLGKPFARWVPVRMAPSHDVAVP